jgi:uncharacterized membrane protein YbhN (UPF0104 family)
MTVSWKKQAIGWVLTGLVLVYIGFTTDLDSFARTVLNAKLPLFLLAILIFEPVSFLVDSSALYLLLKASGAKIPFVDAVRTRGASFLFNIVNYQLALVSMAAILNKRTDKGGAEAAGFVLFLGAADLWAVSIVALVGLSFGGTLFEPAIRTPLMVGAFTVALSGPVALVFGRKISRLWPTSIVARILDVLANLSFKNALKIGLLKCLQMLILTTSDWIFMRSFGIELPIFAAYMGMPIVNVVAVLPFSISGLGGGQVAMRQLFAAWAPASVVAVAAIDASSTCSLGAVLVFRLCVALVFLPWAITTMATSKSSQI